MATNSNYTHRLAQLEDEYSNIIHSDLPDKELDKQLASLMTTMEREFQIPALQNPEWESQNKSVIAMYRKLSHSRKTI